MHKHVKMVKQHQFSSLGVHNLDFAKTQLNFVQSHNHTTVTFRSSACMGGRRGVVVLLVLVLVGVVVVVGGKRRGLIGLKAICIALAAEVYMFPILRSPYDVALIFRTCQLHTAWQFLHEISGSEHPSTWHGKLLHWQDRQHPG